MKPYLLCMFAAFRYVTRARIRYECGFVHCAWPTVFFLCPPERSLPGALASLVLYPARVLFFWGRRRPPTNRCSHTAWSRGSEQSWHRSWPYLIPSESTPLCTGFDPFVPTSLNRRAQITLVCAWSIDRSLRCFLSGRTSPSKTSIHTHNHESGTTQVVGSVAEGKQCICGSDRRTSAEIARWGCRCSGRLGSGPFFNYPWPMSFEPTERRRAVLTGHSLSADRPLPFLAARFVLRRCSAVGVCSTGVTLQCSEWQVQQKPRQ